MNPARRQQGVIFLAMVLVLVVAGGAFTLSALNNRQTLDIARQQEIYEELEIAREAVIAYARYSYDHFSAVSGLIPGLLPCPDTDNDGVADEMASCDPATDYIGRLPQYVDMPDTYAGSSGRFYLNDTYAGVDRQFWYAVSPNFLQTTLGTLPLNGLQTGTLTLDGATDIVAVVIAPGEAIDLDQNREQNPNNYAEYLEGGNGVDLNFVTSYEANPAAFNDTVLAITRSEIWQAEESFEVVAAAIRTRLDAYYTLCGYYPRTFRSNACALNFAVASNGAAFRNWINAASNTVNWIKETAYGGDDWVASSAMTYAVTTSPASATISFRQVDTAECVRFVITTTEMTGPTTVSSC